jgi:uncharacterized protein
MSSLADRLRGVIRPKEGGPEGPPLRPWDPLRRSESDTSRGAPSGAHGGHDPAEILGGEWRESEGHRFVTVDRTYLPGHRHGRVSIADGLPPSEGLWPRLSLLAGASCGQSALFLDLETTGLAGGAGTQAFLVGCAWFDGGVFRIRQFFLSSLTAERAMLEAITELASATGTIVTYNGKTFDLPLIETRFLFHRLETPFAGIPHVDMLHSARRLWRQDEAVAVSDSWLRANGSGSCRLTVVEGTQCGYVREDDVPGFEIPSRYFHFVRTGDARSLAGVFEHNRLDLLSLALLTARAAQLLEEGPAAARTAREALGLGRLFERGGMMGEAHACYARAAGIDIDSGGLEASFYHDAMTDSPTRVEALRAFALLSRRERRHDEAAMAWQCLFDTPGLPTRITREAVEALAVHHEHRLRDPLSARGFALKSLDFQGSPTRRQAIHHRLARLGRKMGQQIPANAPLF